MDYNNYDRGYAEPAMTSADYMSRTYRWMACGLLVTFAAAFVTATTPLLYVVNSLYLHFIIQLAAPPFLSYLIHRYKSIFMSHFNTVCKNLYLIDSIMIGFRHCEKRIHNLGIFGICHIIIHVFLIDHFFNIRRIGKIIDQSCIYFDLAVNTFSGLFQDG